MKAKKMIAMLLALVLCIGAIPFGSIKASAASTSWPSLSESAYCEFKATKNIYVYRNSSCSTRGTSSPAKSYNAYIETGDVCKILSINSNYILVKYPVGSSYRTGYIKRSALFSVSAPTSSVTSKGKATTYVSPGGSSYGYTESGDKIYTCGTSGCYTLIIYSAKSGSRAFKLGYVSTSDLQSKISTATSNTTSSKTNTNTSNTNKKTSSSTNASNTWTTTVTINANSLEAWSEEIKQKELGLTGFGQVRGNATSIWVEQGAVIVNRQVLSYKRVKVTVPPTYGPSTGSGKTVYINLPYKIKYTVHEHEYGARSNSQYWGNFMVGLVNLQIVHTQSCSCGKSYTCSWSMPELSFEKVNVGSTYTISTRIKAN